MATQHSEVPTNTSDPMPLELRIKIMREQKVLLDADLAELYGVPTKALVQAVKRNLTRFPADFMFQLDSAEWESLRSQAVTSNQRRNPSTSKSCVLLSGLDWLTVHARIWLCVWI